MDNLLAFARIHRSLTPANPEGELEWMPALRNKLAAKMEFYREEFS